ncbi:hypothetical protein [Streptomyces muensis]|uniref:hypothetical protein n=1 Tax=Streptomyces muensis TaxID=1077944 RepID=UPI003FD72E58
MSTGTTASASHGTLAHLVSATGGRLADRTLDSYRAVRRGGIPIACVHYAMTVPAAGTTWVGLDLISAGIGPLKPNVATMTGKLYRTRGWHRGFPAAEYALAPPATRPVMSARGHILLETSGMSATTKLAPAAVSSRTMPLWLPSLALANRIQAQAVKFSADVSRPVHSRVNGATAVTTGLAVTAAAP